MGHLNRSGIICPARRRHCGPDNSAARHVKQRVAGHAQVMRKLMRDQTLKMAHNRCAQIVQQFKCADQQRCCRHHIAGRGAGCSAFAEINECDQTKIPSCHNQAGRPEQRVGYAASGGENDNLSSSRHCKHGIFTRYTAAPAQDRATRSIRVQCSGCRTNTMRLLLPRCEIHRQLYSIQPVDQMLM